MSAAPLASRAVTASIRAASTARICSVPPTPRSTWADASSLTFSICRANAASTASAPVSCASLAARVVSWSDVSAERYVCVCSRMTRSTSARAASSAARFAAALAACSCASTVSFAARCLAYSRLMTSSRSSAVRSMLLSSSSSRSCARFAAKYAAFASFDCEVPKSADFLAARSRSSTANTRAADAPSFTASVAFRMAMASPLLASVAIATASAASCFVAVHFAVASACVVAASAAAACFCSAASSSDDRYA